MEQPRHKPEERRLQLRGTGVAAADGSGGSCAIADLDERVETLTGDKASQFGVVEHVRQRFQLGGNCQALGKRRRIIDCKNACRQRLCQRRGVRQSSRHRQGFGRQGVAALTFRAETQFGGQLAGQTHAQQTIRRPQCVKRGCVERHQPIIDRIAPLQSAWVAAAQRGLRQPVGIA